MEATTSHRARHSVAYSQQFLPLAKFALKAHALRDLYVEMTHRSIWLPDLPA